MERTRDQSAFRQTIMASTLGSCVATAVLNPILIVKVHLQKARVAKDAASVDIRSTIHDVLAKRGITGFWAGMPMGLMQSVPSTVTYMLIYEGLKDGLKKIMGPASPVTDIAPGIAGGLARCVSATLISPIELIRTIQASGVGQSSFYLANNLYKRRGIGGFYLGLRATLMRDAPYSFLYWQSYQMMRDVVAPGGIEGANSVVSVFLSGSAAAVAAATATHPFDVLKTTQQVNIRSLSLQPPTVCLAADCTTDAPLGSVLELYNRGGVKACFRGLSMRLAMVIPGGAIMVTVYEVVKRITQSANAEK